MEGARRGVHFQPNGAQQVYYLFRLLPACNKVEEEPNYGNTTAVLPSSPIVVANWSATSFQSFSANPAAATNSAGCRPAGSVPAVLGSNETEGKRAAPQRSFPTQKN